MRLATIAIRDYRNLERVELAIPASGMILMGENGHGKTNFLEAVYYLQILRAVRGARDVDLVRFGAEAFHVAGTVSAVQRLAVHEIAVGFERAGKRKRVRLDGVVVERLSDALGALPSVMFSPADVELVSGEPAARRRYLDVLLALTSRRYLQALQRYRAALARRNAVLREGVRRGASGGARRIAEEAAVWEPMLAEHGAVLWAERRQWVEESAPRLGALCTAIGEVGRVRMRYAGGGATDDPDPVARLSSALEEKRELDVRRGMTHVGPHRDNVLLTIDGRELRAFGSAGQQRTAAIALRILESETYRDRTGGAPVFLMDDPFAELDARRSARIVELLGHVGLGQTLLAVPRASDIPSGFSALPVARVESGRVEATEG